MQYIQNITVSQNHWRAIFNQGAAQISKLHDGEEMGPWSKERIYSAVQPTVCKSLIITLSTTPDSFGQSATTFNVLQELLHLQGTPYKVSIGYHWNRLLEEKSIMCSSCTIVDVDSGYLSPRLFRAVFVSHSCPSPLFWIPPFLSSS
jgi:hypothetical protein